ncbi:hypothetical protein Tco_0552085 [Tanacetum coccineum]
MAELIGALSTPYKLSKIAENKFAERLQSFNPGPPFLPCSGGGGDGLSIGDVGVQGKMVKEEEPVTKFWDLNHRITKVYMRWVKVFLSRVEVWLVVAGCEQYHVVGLGFGRKMGEMYSVFGLTGVQGECAILNFNYGSTFCKFSMLHVPPENNKFEGEIIPCSDFRLAHPNLAASDHAFDTPRDSIGTTTLFQKLLVFPV